MEDPGEVRVDPVGKTCHECNYHNGDYCYFDTKAVFRTRGIPACAVNFTPKVVAGA